VTRRIAVIGGGITGLAAAYEVRRHDPDAEIVLHEATNRFGGKIATTPFADRAVDEGADAFLARVPWGLELCEELGVATELVSPAQQAAYVWCDGELRRLPAGLVLGVPTDFDALAASGIVREPVTVQPAAAPLAPEDDVSVGELVRGQLGDAVFERLVDPLLGGINAGDADHLSVRAGAPQLAAAAERSPNLVEALRTQQTGASPGPVFYAPVGGMGVLVDALMEALTASGVQLRAESPIDSIASLGADGVIVTVPAYEAAELLRGIAPAAATFLDNISYASVALVTMAFHRAAGTRPLDASGFLVPRTEGLLMTATSWTSSKWAHLDGDMTIVRVSAGKFGDDRATNLDDDQLVGALLDEVAMTSQLRGEPQQVRVTRWPRSFPQYEPGHLDRVDHVEQLIAQHVPHVVLAGAALRGLGVPACIRQGREAARELLAR
jgi:oxygen-dependent protoporphyrinogen oxidase